MPNQKFNFLIGLSITIQSSDCDILRIINPQRTRAAWTSFSRFLFNSWSFSFVDLRWQGRRGTAEDRTRNDPTTSEAWEKSLLDTKLSLPNDKQMQFLLTKFKMPQIVFFCPRKQKLFFTPTHRDYKYLLTNNLLMKSKKRIKKSILLKASKVDDNA